MFSWIGNTGTIDASDLNLRASDEMPRALFVTSQRTGVTKLFTFEKMEIDICEEQYWVYACRKSYQPTLFIKIFND